MEKIINKQKASTRPQSSSTEVRYRNAETPIDSLKKYFLKSIYYTDCTQKRQHLFSLLVSEHQFDTFLLGRLDP
jgi:hypothetical protein